VQPHETQKITRAHAPSTTNPFITPPTSSTPHEGEGCRLRRKCGIRIELSRNFEEIGNLRKNQTTAILLIKEVTKETFKIL
jgi:hypothetical protein